MKTIALVFSVLLNIGLAGLLLYITLQGCAETPGERVGVLTKDIKVGVFNTKKTLFTLPKGLVVRDASATGADRFEPHRFRIVVTSESADLVNFTDTPGPSEQKEYYSSEVGSK